MAKTNNCASRREMSVEKQEGKKVRKNMQQIACDWMYENYVAFGRLRFDVVSQKVQIRQESQIGGYTIEEWTDITDRDINKMICDCCNDPTGGHVSSKQVLTVLKAGDPYIPEVHPLRDYLNSLTPYNPYSGDWIDQLAQHVRVKVEDPKDFELLDSRWRICFKKWFVGMVATWMDDNVVNHQVLVLVGKQGIFKTTWLESLLPPHLRRYCCKMANPHHMNKDERLRIAEFALVNFDELESLNPKGLGEVKSIITASDVNERGAWGYTKERRLRLASFCASTNNRRFLSDITGNRRWLPFEIENIKDPHYTVIPYSYVYAQAKYLVETGFNYWFDLDDIAALEEHNEDYRSQDSEEQLIPIVFDIPAEGKGEFMTTAEIRSMLRDTFNIATPINVEQLGIIMGRLNFPKACPRIMGKKTRGWYVYKRTPEEIAALKRTLR